ncbi:DUF4132 domain-containing protein [Corynebacterium choanae]|uniref:DUF4132 domain-containing protein n=1 Tax=Corynebacterium choanae TaxID=1862358 RepID=A0A3G6J9E4_9CORY|nr:DUF4132 domain-containing protein [Corynebacterium choanae]AZA13508.1 hypothetical protein CCHOA_05540 [Corynebacterium choanae]
MSINDLLWVSSGDYSYAFSSEGTIVVRKRSHNTILEEIPKRAKRNDVYKRMKQAIKINKELAEADADHKPLVPEINRSLRSWMTGDTSWTAATLIERWADKHWRKALSNLVIEVGGKKGFLTDIQDKTVMITRRSGRVRKISVKKNDPILLPHPTTMKRLTQWQDAAERMGIQQGYRQLERPVFRNEPDIEAMEQRLQAHAGGRWYRQGPDSRLDALCAREGMEIHDGQIETKYETKNGGVVKFVAECLTTKPGELTTMFFFFTDGDGQPLDQVSHAIYSESIRTAMILKAQADVQLDALPKM